MAESVFLAGATGAIGTALIPLLIDAGYTVYGSTRHAQRAAKLENAGVTPVIVDVFDLAALTKALARIEPASVIHQLTDLPRNLDPAQMAHAVVNNARIRSEGTRNLVAAASAAGARRFVAQSIAWAYRTGTRPYTETSPLDIDAPAPRSISVQGVVALETCVLEASAMTGTVLRYGQIYGPGTGSAEPAGTSPVHVEAAAAAALLALRYSPGGIYNIAEDEAEVSSAKARRELGWLPSLRNVKAADQP
ncbi:NAD-dependent epimerase/dehydratase family protein [Paraburkholderia sp. GAS199]|uniref:NAD-dependent epimerase/dehydratase family protein n=1 Tax=Paraburkholderia sp. GAS199 TaxID=3035126 RepID=UPI003D21E8B7